MSSKTGGVAHSLRFLLCITGSLSDELDYNHPVVLLVCYLIVSTCYVLGLSLFVSEYLGKVFFSVLVQSLSALLFMIMAYPSFFFLVF